VAPEKQPTCEAEDCSGTQRWAVSGQWSLVDFLTYYVCDDHVTAALDRIDQLQFDGNPVVEVLVQAVSTTS
jgi:hypothetical protein